MKRSTKALTFAAVAAAGLAVSGCWRDFVAVYGPPPDETDGPEVDVYGPPPGDVVDGQEEDVYGPPIDDSEG